jgi:sodium-dependent dicarboxylate transporter 2/3/5
MHSPWRIVHQLAAPAFFILILAISSWLPMEAAAVRVLALTIWMAWWWITEAAPIPVTSLLPLIGFPLLGVSSITDTGAAYGHPMVFLYMGGFLLSLAVEKWELHRRVALSIMAVGGVGGKQLVLGSMLATALISMWISNTATAVMMLPIMLALISQFEKGGNKVPAGLDKALLLGIAYAASIGGIATLIGSPTNVVFTAMIRKTYNQDFSFFQWMLVGLPVAAVLLFITWQALIRRFQIGMAEGGLGKDAVKSELKALGKPTRPERAVGIVFLFAALSWMTRTLWAPLLPTGFPVDDTIIALVAGLVLFVIPSGEGGALMDWKTAHHLPWDILLLFGGGLALAEGFTSSGLSVWIGANLLPGSGVPFWIVLLIVIAGINFLTEMTSNVATCSMILPILAALASDNGMNPYLLMGGATIAASCAFMLPVGTPPNAVVFGSGRIRMMDMVKTGFALNLISIGVIFLILTLLAPLVWPEAPQP